MVVDTAVMTAPISTIITVMTMIKGECVYNYVYIYIYIYIYIYTDSIRVVKAYDLTEQLFYI